MRTILFFCAAAAGIVRAADLPFVDTGVRVNPSGLRSTIDSAGNTYFVGRCTALANTGETQFCVKNVAPDGRAVYQVGVGSSARQIVPNPLPVDYRITSFAVDEAGNLAVAGSGSRGPVSQKFDSDGRSVYLNSTRYEPTALTATRDGLIGGQLSGDTGMDAPEGTLPKPSFDPESRGVHAIAVRVGEAGETSLRSWLPAPLAAVTRIVAKPDGGLVVVGETSRYQLTAGVAVRRPLKTTDGGLTWTALQETLSPDAPAMAPKPAVHPQNPDVLYAVGGDFVYRSDDAGATWNRIASLPDAKLSTILVHPKDAATMYAIGGDWRQFGAPALNHYSVYRSADGGATWKKIASADMERPAIGLDPGDVNRVYLARLNRFEVSTDGGSEWKLLNESLWGLKDIAVDPTNSSRVFVADGNTGYRSLDQGQTFQRLNKRFRRFLFDRANSGAVFGLIHDYIAVSRDMGATWSEPSGDADGWYQAISEAEVVNGRWYGYTGSSLVKSTDAGATWTEMTEPNVRVPIAGFSVAPSDSDRVYATLNRAQDTYIAGIRGDFSAVDWSVQTGTFGVDTVTDAFACEQSVTYTATAGLPDSDGSGFVGMIDVASGSLTTWNPPGVDRHRTVLTSAFQNCATGERVVAGYVVPNDPLEIPLYGFVGRLSAGMEYTEIGRIPAARVVLVRPGAENGIRFVGESWAESGFVKMIVGGI